jgi:outer membrane protein
LVLLTLTLPLTLIAQDTTVVRPQAPPDRYEVGQALPPLEPGGTLVEMTLEEAIARALERNLDIQTARLTPEVQAYALQASRAVFVPTVSGNFGYNNSTNQSTSQLDGGARTSTERHTANLALSQTVPWYGGRLSLDFNNSRTATDNSFATLNPSYRSTLSVNYTQPLLAGRRTDPQRTAIEALEIQSEISRIQLDGQVWTVTDLVRASYWQLRASIEQIEIQRRSLAQAEQLLADNRVRVQLGTLPPIQIVQAEAQVAAAEQLLLNAEVQWRNQELVFKSLLIDGAEDPLLYQTINPTDLPVVQEESIDLEAALERALGERIDIRTQRQQRRISELDLEVTKDVTRPELNLVAGYSLLGVGGDRFERSELGGEPQLIAEGGYVDGLRSIGDLDTPTWNVGMSFSYPIGMKAADANLERAEIQLRQSDLAIRTQELAIVTEVTDAALAVNDTRLQLEAAQRSRELAEQSAAVELTRFNAGVSTNFEVAAAREALTQSLLSELRALINHINAQAEFERVQRVG